MDSNSSLDLEHFLPSYSIGVGDSGDGACHDPVNIELSLFDDSLDSSSTSMLLHHHDFPFKTMMAKSPIRISGGGYLTPDDPSPKLFDCTLGGGVNNDQFFAPTDAPPLFDNLYNNFITPGGHHCDDDTLLSNSSFFLHSPESMCNCTPLIVDTPHKTLCRAFDPSYYYFSNPDLPSKNPHLAASITSSSPASAASSSSPGAWTPPDEFSAHHPVEAPSLLPLLDRRMDTMLYDNENDDYEERHVAPLLSPIPVDSHEGEFNLVGKPLHHYDESDDQLNSYRFIHNEDNNSTLEEGEEMVKVVESILGTKSNLLENVNSLNPPVAMTMKNVAFNDPNNVIGVFDENNNEILANNDNMLDMVVGDDNLSLGINEVINTDNLFDVDALDTADLIKYLDGITRSLDKDITDLPPNTTAKVSVIRPLTGNNSSNLPPTLSFRTNNTSLTGQDNEKRQKVNKLCPAAAKRFKKTTINAHAPFNAPPPSEHSKITHRYMEGLHPSSTSEMIGTCDGPSTIDRTDILSAILADLQAKQLKGEYDDEDSIKLAVAPAAPNASQDNSTLSPPPNNPITTDQTTNNHHLLIQQICLALQNESSNINSNHNTTNVKISDPSPPTFVLAGNSALGVSLAKNPKIPISPMLTTASAVLSHYNNAGKSSEGMSRIHIMSANSTSTNPTIYPKSTLTTSATCRTGRTSVLLSNQRQQHSNNYKHTTPVNIKQQQQQEYPFYDSSAFISNSLITQEDSRNNKTSCLHPNDTSFFNSTSSIAPSSTATSINYMENYELDENVQQDFLDIQKLKQCKKIERMIKNRESASLSRKRKKEYMKCLEDQIETLTKEKTCLETINTSLKMKINALEHENCALKKVIPILKISRPGVLCCLSFLAFVYLFLIPQQQTDSIHSKKPFGPMFTSPSHLSWYHHLGSGGNNNDIKYANSVFPSFPMGRLFVREEKPLIRVVSSPKRQRTDSVDVPFQNVTPPNLMTTSDTTLDPGSGGNGVDDFDEGLDIIHLHHFNRIFKAYLLRYMSSGQTGPGASLNNSTNGAVLNNNNSSTTKLDCLNNNTDASSALTDFFNITDAAAVWRQYPFFGFSNAGVRTTNNNNNNSRLFGNPSISNNFTAFHDNNLTYSGKFDGAVLNNGHDMYRFIRRFLKYLAAHWDETLSWGRQPTPSDIFMNQNLRHGRNFLFPTGGGGGSGFKHGKMVMKKFNNNNIMMDQLQHPNRRLNGKGNKTRRRQRHHTSRQNETYLKRNVVVNEKSVKQPTKMTVNGTVSMMGDKILSKIPEKLYTITNMRSFKNYHRLLLQHNSSDSKKNNESLLYNLDMDSKMSIVWANFMLEYFKNIRVIPGDNTSALQICHIL